MNIADTILGWIKLSPKYILPLFVLTASLLFLPTTYLARFGIDVLVASYRMWIGLVCLSSFSLLISHFGFWIKDKLIASKRTRQFLKLAKASLHNLTPAEKAVLAEFILLQTKSMNLDFQSGVTNGLEHARIIYRSASVGSLLDGFAYNLQPWAWEELNKHPELLEPELSERIKELKAKRHRRY